MTIKEYQKKVERTLNTNLLFREKLSMLCMGLSGETGELIDLLKKSLYHKHDFQTDKAIKEIGDIMWYLISLCNVLNLSIEDIMDKNIDKLEDRYPDGFSYDKSINRNKE